MDKTNNYAFTLVPLQTDMTVKEFRQAVMGDEGNFALLDTILAAIDIVACSMDLVTVGGEKKYVLRLKRKDGSETAVDFPDMGDVKAEEMHQVTEEELDSLWNTVFPG